MERDDFRRRARPYPDAPTRGSNAMCTYKHHAASRRCRRDRALRPDGLRARSCPQDAASQGRRYLGRRRSTPPSRSSRCSAAKRTPNEVASRTLLAFPRPPRPRTSRVSWARSGRRACQQRATREQLVESLRDVGDRDRFHEVRIEPGRP